MDVQLSPDQKAFARHAIEAGRIQHEEDAVHQALALWEARERTRSEILAAVDLAETSLARKLAQARKMLQDFFAVEAAGAPGSGAGK